VRDSDSLHIDQRHAKILAISEKERSLGPGIEQQFIVTLARIGGQDECQTELRAAQRVARDGSGTGCHDVVELGRDVVGFARVIVTHIIERDIDNEPVNWPQVLHRIGFPQKRSSESKAHLYDDRQ
jgi:hypothetical protein